MSSNDKQTGGNPPRPGHVEKGLAQAPPRSLVVVSVKRLKTQSPGKRRDDHSQRPPAAPSATLKRRAEGSPRSYVITSTELSGVLALNPTSQPLDNGGPFDETLSQGVSEPHHLRNITYGPPPRKAPRTEKLPAQKGTMSTNPVSNATATHISSVDDVGHMSDPRPNTPVTDIRYIDVAPMCASRPLALAAEYLFMCVEDVWKLQPLLSRPIKFITDIDRIDAIIAKLKSNVNIAKLFVSRAVFNDFIRMAQRGFLGSDKLLVMSGKIGNIIADLPQCKYIPIAGEDFRTDTRLHMSSVMKTEGTRQ